MEKRVVIKSRCNLSSLRLHDEVKKKRTKEYRELTKMLINKNKYSKEERLLIIEAAISVVGKKLVEVQISRRR